MRYTYDVVDARDNTVETNFNSEEEARLYIDVKREQGVQDTNTWRIVEQSHYTCLLYTSPSPRDRTRSRMPSSA